MKRQNEDIALFDEITTWTRVNKVIKNYTKNTRLYKKAEMPTDDLYEEGSLLRRGAIKVSKCLNTDLLQ
jgi:hypothetical protein